MGQFLSLKELLLYYDTPLTNVLINENLTPEETEGMEFQYAFTRSDKEYYYPKTYYTNIYTTSGHQEGINGSYNENGNWVDWH